MVKRTLLVLVSTTALLGCMADTDEEFERNAEVDEIVENLELAGYPTSEIAVDEAGVVMVGGDAVVTLEASREMVSTDGFRQYRTTNLVDDGAVQTICVDGSGLSGVLSTALDNAIANYNGLNLSLAFVRSGGGGAGTNPAGAGKGNGNGNGGGGGGGDGGDGGGGACGATITVAAKGPAGGQAGFPEGGLPYGQVQVGKGTANYGVAVATHVITHELGHCIGLRHSDYYNRAISCGSGGNEGSAGVGAIHIQGTPTDAVEDGSVMNSCFHSGSTGEFTGSDVNAFKALY